MPPVLAVVIDSGPILLGRGKFPLEMKQEKRQSADRRLASTPPPFGRYALGGRRENARRKDEDSDYYVDRYKSRYLLIIIGIVILCLLDGFLTLGLIQRGGFEYNPIMFSLIQQNLTLFLVVKICMTSFGLIFLLIHMNFRFFGRVRSNYLIYTILSLYLILIIYELYLYIANRLL